ncbi:MAG TPA: hypothetical protein VKE51_28635 [Vicinamibacterales bacterium]|nr:hypothetical protein [Vicinamibacterales bacterium]
MKIDGQRVSRPNISRTVSVVARDPQPAVLDTVLEAGENDVIFMESIEHAYSGIKRSMPDMVIVCLGIDDPESFHLLSMLALDAETAQIPVCTYVVTPQVAASDATGVGSFQRASAPSFAAMMN